MPTQTALTADFVGQVVRLLQGKRPDVTFSEATEEKLEDKQVYAIPCWHKEQELLYTLTLTGEFLQIELYAIGEPENTYQQGAEFLPPFYPNFVAGILLGLLTHYEDGRLKILVEVWLAEAEKEFAKNFDGGRKTSISVSSGKLTFAASLLADQGSYKIEFELTAVPGETLETSILIYHGDELIGQFLLADDNGHFGINQFRPAVISQLFNFLYRAAVVGIADEHLDVLGNL